MGHVHSAVYLYLARLTEQNGGRFTSTAAAELEAFIRQEIEDADATGQPLRIQELRQGIEAGLSSMKTHGTVDPIAQQQLTRFLNSFGTAEVHA